MNEVLSSGQRLFGAETYTHGVQGGPCFVCAIVAGLPGYGDHQVIHEDSETIAFLPRQSSLIGYCLVAPKRHVESLVDGLDLEEYLRVHAVVYRVAKAVSEVVPTERVHVLSLGTRPGDTHVHWHVAPLPPGVTFEPQLILAAGAENGSAAVSPADQAALAAELRATLSRSGAVKTPINGVKSAPARKPRELSDLPPAAMRRIRRAARDAWPRDS